MAQKRNGHDVSIIANATAYSGYCTYPAYREKLQNANIPLFEIDTTFKRDFDLNFQAAQLISSRYSDIDCLHAHAAIPGMIGIMARGIGCLKFPIIMTMHGWGKNKTVDQEREDCRILNHLDQIISVSKNGVNLLKQKGIDDRKIHYIPNGIELINEATSKINIQIVKDLAELKAAGKKLIACVGSVNERKNQRLFIDAIEQCASRCNAVGVIIGEGATELMDKSNSNGKSIDNLRFYGYLPDAHNYFKYFDCLVLPTLSEGMPIVVLEAFREKLPVIASDLPELREIIYNGVNGYLFVPGQVTDLAATIDHVLGMGKSAQQKIVGRATSLFAERFTLDRMYANYRRVYEITFARLNP